MEKDIDKKTYPEIFNYINTRDMIYDTLSQIFYERAIVDNSLSKKQWKSICRIFLIHIFFLKNSIIERVIHKSTTTIINITKNIN